MIHPVILGGGKRLFKDGSDQKALELIDPKVFGTSVVYLAYRPVNERKG